MRRYATSSRGPRSRLGGVYSGRSSRTGRPPSVDSRRRTQAYSGNDESLRERGYDRPMSSASSAKDSELISTFDPDSSGRPAPPDSPVMDRTPSNQGSPRCSIQSLSSHGSRAHDSHSSQPRVGDFNGRSSNEARSSMTASPSGGRGDGCFAFRAYIQKKSR